MPGFRKKWQWSAIALLATLGTMASAKEPGNSFLDPSGALAPAGRVSAGVAEKYTKGYLLHKSSMEETDDPKPTHQHHGQSSQASAPESANQAAEPAEEPEEEESPEENERTTLLPDDMHTVGGIRWEVLYTGEVFNNMRGGINTQDAARYRGNLDIVFTYDTEANNLWEGGEFFVYGSNTHGKTLTPEFVGDFQFYSNIDSNPHPNLMQVSEYWYLHRVVDGIFSVKLGKCDANADFAYMELASDFVHASYSLSTNIFLPTWPNQALGVVAFWEPREKLSFNVGVYDGAGDGRLWGFTTLGDNGAFVIGQAKWSPQFGDKEDMPGTYRLGIWEHTGDFAFVQDFDNEFVCTSGIYGTLEQLIWKEPETEEQGFGMFGQISHASADPIFSTLDTHWSVGGIYRGWFDGRDADTFGVGLTNLSFKSGNFNPVPVQRQEETAIEAFYKIQVNSHTTLQPDLQFICNPGGDGSIQDAFLFGLRFQTAL
jgi:porin